MNAIPYYDIKKQAPSLFSELSPVWDKTTSFIDKIITFFDEKRRMFPAQTEQIHLVGTQDTANIVDNMQQYLINNIGRTVSSEIS